MEPPLILLFCCYLGRQNRQKDKKEKKTKDNFFVSNTALHYYAACNVKQSKLRIRPPNYSQSTMACIYYFIILLLFGFYYFIILLFYYFIILLDTNQY